MKEGVYSILKAKFLVSNGSTGNWGLIVFVFLLSMIMIANNHFFETKLTKIVKLQAELKEYRSEFVDVRSRLMQLKMESSVSKKMESIQIYPSDVPPVRIKILKKKAE
jgi:hypothetical protein